MADRWIKLYEKVEHSSIYQDSELVHLWVHLLIKSQKFEKTFPWNDGEVVLSPGQLLTGRKRLCNETGISESKIQRALNRFEKCHMIEQQITNKFRIITILNWDKYQSSEQQTNNKRTGNEQVTNRYRTGNEHIQERKKEESNNKEKISMVIDYLNRKLGTSFKPTASKTITCINARINEGYSGEDFKTVINKKCKEWKGTEHEKYLRPETLFGSKFDGYLNQITSENKEESPTLTAIPGSIRV